MVSDFLAVDIVNLTTLISREKLSKKKFCEKLVKMSLGYVKTEFMDKNLTCRIVCPSEEKNLNEIVVAKKEWKMHFTVVEIVLF